MKISQSKLALSLSVITLFSLNLFAQGNTSRTKISNKSIFEDKATVFLDGTSMLLKGGGVKATYATTQNLTLGGAAAIQKMNTSDSASFSGVTWTSESEHKLTRFSLLADYFFTDSYNKSGVYGTLGVSTVSVKSTTQDSLFGSGSANDSQTGVLAKLGYQITSSTNIGANFVCQFGLGFGPGHKVKYYYYPKTKTELSSGLDIDISAGLQF